MSRGTGINGPDSPVNFFFLKTTDLHIENAEMTQALSKSWLYVVG